MHEPRREIFGGSGLVHELPIDDVEQIAVHTPCGELSDRVTLGTIQGQRVAFLHRYVPGHSIPPNEINVWANIASLNHVGCSRLISLSAVGGLADGCAQGTFVIPDQFIDKARARGATTFFGQGLVGHVPFSKPTCGSLRNDVIAQVSEMELPLIKTGTYVVMDGPQCSTRAESRLHRGCGGTVIGMTAIPKANLAKEAELCYAMIAMDADQDCAADAVGHVTTEVVSATMNQLAEQVQHHSRCEQFTLEHQVAVGLSLQSSPRRIRDDNSILPRP